MVVTLTSITADGCAAAQTAKDAATTAVTSTDEVALADTTEMIRFRKDSKTLFNINDINCDLNKDGKVTQDEKKVQAHLQSVADPDGNIKSENLRQLLLLHSSQNKDKRTLKLLAVVCVTMMVFLIGAMVGVCWTANAAFVNADKKKSTNSQPVTAMDGVVVATAAAKAYLPLRAAPILTIERLASISELTVQIHNYPSTGIPGPPSMMPQPDGTSNRVYHITSAVRQSDTEVYFETASPGHVIHIKDGEALIKVFEDGNMTWSASVCSDSITCAALRVDTEQEGKELLAVADQAVARRRLEIADSAPSVVPENERQLHACDQPSCSTPMLTSLSCETQAEYSMACMQTVVSDRAFCFINDWCLHPCICCSWKMKFCPAFESSRFGTTNALVLPADWAESCTPYGWSDGACSAGRRLLAKGAKDDKDEASFEDDGETLRQSQARSRHSRRLDKCAAG